MLRQREWASLTLKLNCRAGWIDVEPRKAVMPAWSVAAIR
jgi:hypothetical protein